MLLRLTAKAMRGKVAAARLLELVPSVLAHVIESSDDTVFSTRDQNRLAEIFEDEKVARLRDVAGSTRQ